MGFVQSKATFVDGHVRHHESSVRIIEFVIFEASDVNKTVGHYHSTMVSNIIFPDSFEDTAITPDHFTFAFSLSLEEVSVVLSNLELAISVCTRN